MRASVDKGRSILSMSFTLPGCGRITTTRCARNTASSMLCVTNIMEMPVCCHRRIRSSCRRGSRNGIDSGKGFIHKQYAWPIDQCPCDRNALSHAARQLVRITIGGAIQPYLRQCLSCPVTTVLLWLRLACEGRIQHSGATSSRRIARTPGRRHHARDRAREPSAPSKRTVPSDGWINPAIRCNSVVFPHPDGPIRQTNSPSLTLSEARHKAQVGSPWRVAKICETRSTSTRV